MHRFTSTGDIAAALRSLAAQLDAAGSRTIAPTAVDVDLQVVQFAAHVADRCASVHQLAGVLGVSASVLGVSPNYSALCQTEDGVTVHAFTSRDVRYDPAGVRHPPGTPEYRRYVAELAVELGKFARREGEYAGGDQLDDGGRAARALGMDAGDAAAVVEHVDAAGDDR